MDAEAINALGTQPVRISPSHPSTGQESASSGSTGESEKIKVAGGVEDTVTISPEARTQQPEGKAPEAGISGGSGASQSRFAINENNEVVLKIVDANGQEIREIPAKEQQRLSRAIQDTVDKLVSDKNK